jgi:hypothetical protein
LLAPGALLLLTLATPAAGAVVPGGVRLAAADVLPKVTLLPLQAGPGVDDDTALGMTTLMREALERAEAGAEEDPFLDLLPEGKKDDRRVKACRADGELKPAADAASDTISRGCLTKIMNERGSDLLGAGTVTEDDEGGLVIELVVLAQGEGVVRSVIEPIVGDDIPLVMDKVIRKAFVPRTLAGSIIVVGEPAGAEVLVDGKIAGELPLDGPLLGITEGFHTVTVRKDGYKELSKPARVRFRQTVELEIVLTPGGEEPPPTREEQERLLTGVHVWGPAATAGVAGAIAAGGVVFGALALVQALQVQQKAEVQQLTFPQDAFLVQSGQVFAVIANVLYGAAFVVAAGAGGWIGTVLAIDLLSTPEEGELEAAAVGAPEAQAPVDNEDDIDDDDDGRMKLAPAFEVPEEEGEEEEVDEPLPLGDERPKAKKKSKKKRKKKKRKKREKK